MKDMTTPRPTSGFPAAIRPPRFFQLIRIFFLGLLSLSISLLVGCGKPPMLVQQYILEYPAPGLGQNVKIPASIKVEQFSVAQAFNTNAMVFQPQPFKHETYNYSRWRVNPGFLVTDYLLRDLTAAHLFKAVFGPGSSDKYRFLLEGGVEDFKELDEPDGWKAVMALTVTLLDTTQENLPQRVVFQKNYRIEEPMLVKTPQGLAQAMSQAMENISTRIMGDVATAASQRTAGK
jgi:ABC-type uncharacterized transport system auxiliary subunit